MRSVESQINVSRKNSADKNTTKSILILKGKSKSFIFSFSYNGVKLSILATDKIKEAQRYSNHLLNGIAQLFADNNLSLEVLPVNTMGRQPKKLKQTSLNLPERV